MGKKKADENPDEMKAKDHKELQKSGNVPEDGVVADLNAKLIKGAKVQAVNGTYRITKRLGNGAFGVVLRVQNVQTKMVFAMKLENLKVQQAAQQLKIEGNVLNVLNKSRSKHFIGLVDYGIGKDFRYIIIPLVGRSLDRMRNKYLYQQYTTRTALFLIEHTLEAVRDLHDVGFIHRDLKPANFAVDFLGQKTVIMLDFGCARYIRDPWGRMLLPRAKKSFIGTPRYASRAAHLDKDTGRMDDVEAWFYMAVDIWNEGNLTTINGIDDPDCTIKQDANKGKMEAELNKAYCRGKHRFMTFPESRPEFWHPIHPLSCLELPEDYDDDQEPIVLPSAKDPAPQKKKKAVPEETSKETSKLTSVVASGTKGQSTQASAMTKPAKAPSAKGKPIKATPAAGKPANGPSTMSKAVKSEKNSAVSKLLSKQNDKVSAVKAPTTLPPANGTSTMSKAVKSEKNSAVSKLVSKQNDKVSVAKAPTTQPPRKPAGKEKKEEEFEEEVDDQATNGGGTTQGDGGGTTQGGTTQASVMTNGGATVGATTFMAEEQQKKENAQPVKKLKVMPNAFLEIICEINRTQPLCRPNYEDIIDALHSVPRESYFNKVNMRADLDWLNYHILAKVAKAKMRYETRKEAEKKKKKKEEDQWEEQGKLLLQGQAVPKK